MDNRKRNIRAIIILIAAGLFIGIFNFIIMPVSDSFAEMDERIVRLKKKTMLIEKVEKTKSSEQLSAFEMPAKTDEQLIRFASKTEEIFRKNGINLTKEPKYISNKGKRDKTCGMKIFTLQIHGTAKYDQLLKLLGGLRDNPYLLNIEEFDFKRDGKDRRKMIISAKLNTFAL